MAKQVQSGKAKTPDAVKAAAGKIEVKAPSGRVPSSLPVPHISSKALSTDVGPLVIASLDKSYRDEQKANEMLAAVEAKRYDMLGTLTLAVVKAAKADKQIADALPSCVGEDKQAQGRLNDMIGIAIGTREVVTVGEGDKAREKVQVAKAVQKYFPSAGDVPNSTEAKRKATLRTNFATMFKKCQQAALGIYENKIEAKMDKQAGTLLLTGPEIKKQFGQPSVLLNEKQTVGEGDKAVKLQEKPSYTAIAARAAEAHGKVMARRIDSRQTVSGNGNVNLSDSLASVCKSLISILGKIKELTDGHKKELEAVYNAIDQRLSD
jgi:hypothetical protein